MMFARLSLLTLAVIGIAGAANAETIREPAVQVQPIVDHGMSPARGPHKVAITDEYGFHYDAWGNRLNADGYVIAPPRTPPGALVIQDGA